MNQIFKYILLFLSINLEAKKCSCNEISLIKKNGSCLPKTFFLPRSQGTNTARWIVGWERFLAPYKWNKEKGDCPIQNGSINLIVEYTRSFDNISISDYLFGKKCLKFLGSQVKDRNNKRDIIADYLGLSTTFNGAICLNPLIQNIIVEINYYLALDTWIPGLYTRIHFPLTISLWDLGVKTKEKCPKVRPVFPQCYMTGNKSYLKNQSLSNLKQAFSGYGLFGDMNSPFDFGMFPFRTEQKTGIADIYLNLGLTAFATESSYFALYGQIVIPGGNKPEAIKFFEPMVGNGRRWEMGIGSEGRLNLFNFKNQSLEIHFMGYFDYRFKSFQIRSFDFKKNGFFSRYMLLKEFNTDQNYVGNMFNAIDYATKALRAGSQFVGDASIKISYYFHKLGIDVGYNVWGTTAERIHLVKNIYPSDLNHRLFGFKGNAGVCYKILNTETGAVSEGDSLNATESKATSTSIAPIDNPVNIILPAPEVAITWNSPLNNKLIIAQNSDPIVRVFLKDLNLCSAAVPCQLSHKFFAHIDFTKFAVDWEPEIGVGGEVEFNARKKLKSSTSQWGLWTKALIVF